MKTSLSLLTVSILCGCATPEMLPAQSSEVTSIRVLNSEDKSLIKAIQDPQRIEQIVNFINTLDNAWQEASFGEPNDLVEVRLLKDGKFVGNFRVGDDFFGRDHRVNWLQSATDDHLSNFSKLLGVDFQLIQAIIPCDYDVKEAVSKKLTGAGLTRKLNSDMSQSFKKDSTSWCQLTSGDVTYRVHHIKEPNSQVYVEQLGEAVMFFGPFADIPIP